MEPEVKAENQGIQAEKHNGDGALQNGHTGEPDVSHNGTSESSPTRSTRPSSVELVDTSKKEVEDEDEGNEVEAEVSYQ